MAGPVYRWLLCIEPLAMAAMRADALCGATEPRQGGRLLFPLDIHDHLRMEAAHGHDQFQVTVDALKQRHLS